MRLLNQLFYCRIMSINLGNDNVSRFSIRLSFGNNNITVTDYRSHRITFDLKCQIITGP